jgi:hypothetical protein
MGGVDQPYRIIGKLKMINWTAMINVFRVDDVYMNKAGNVPVATTQV